MLLCTELGDDGGELELFAGLTEESSSAATPCSSAWARAVCASAAMIGASRTERQRDTGVAHGEEPGRVPGRVFVQELAGDRRERQAHAGPGHQ